MPAATPCFKTPQSKSKINQKLKGLFFDQTVLLIHNKAKMFLSKEKKPLLLEGNTYAKALDSRSTLPLHLPHCFRYANRVYRDKIVSVTADT